MRARLLLLTASVTSVAVLVAAGCGWFKEEATRPPSASPIERLDELAPPLPSAEEFRPGTQAVLLAKLRVRRTDRSIFLGEWPPEPKRQSSVCYFYFAAPDDSPDAFGPTVQALCDLLSQPLQIRELVELARWPDVTVGTVGASVDEVRLTFGGSCGVATYQATGPLLRSNPTRRVFMLDQSNGCLWKTAEAIRDGTVIQRYMKPSAPRN